MSGKSFFYTIGITFLVTGNLIGAGILGLPINTGLAGFIPSLISMFIIGGAMLCSAIILSREAIKEKAPTFNYPSLYQAYLGPIGKWAAILANLIILYGLLTAYLTGATTIIVNLFNIHAYKSLVLVAFFLLITTLSITETRAIARYNGLLVVMLFATFVMLLFMTEPHVDLSRLRYRDWMFIPATVPIVITSFHFHNIIPNICQSLDWKMSSIWKIILAGMLIGYVMNVLWTLVTIGALPLTGSEASIYHAFKANLPSTVPLSSIIQNPRFMICAMLFAMLAIVTSYITNGMGLLGFFNDLTTNHFRASSKPLSIALTFCPPLIISLAYPDIFLKALNVVGGIGIVLLFGALPSTLIIKQSRTALGKALGIFMFLIFASIFVFELLQEFGLLQIEPHIEYWNQKFSQM